MIFFICSNRLTASRGRSQIHPNAAAPFHPREIINPIVSALTPPIPTGLHGKDPGGIVNKSTFAIYPRFEILSNTGLIKVYATHDGNRFNSAHECTDVETIGPPASPPPALLTAP